jgi:hypothetical protein
VPGCPGDQGGAAFGDRYLCDDRSIGDEQVDPQEIWSAIRYLDPEDERDKDKESLTATIVAALVLLFIVCSVCGLLWLRVRGL